MRCTPRAQTTAFASVRSIVMVVAKAVMARAVSTNAHSCLLGVGFSLTDGMRVTRHVVGQAPHAAWLILAQGEGCQDKARPPHLRRASASENAHRPRLGGSAPDRRISSGALTREEAREASMHRRPGLWRILVPRGGLRQVNQITDLAKSGTINLPTRSLCFLARVSHCPASSGSDIGALTPPSRGLPTVLGEHLGEDLWVE
jgi:hypothetical protein